MQFSCAYVRSCVCGCMWVWVCVYACARVCMRLYVMTSSYFLITSSYTHPPFFFLSSPSLSRLPPPPPCVCVYVCVLFFPSLFPPALKAALHHTPSLHSPSCFDVCYQGISCVRLMFFISGYSCFPIHLLGCLELDFCPSFSRVGLNLGRIVYLRIFLASSPPPPAPRPFFSSSFFLTHSIYSVILLTSRPSPFLV